jgi:hypothetical protein
MVQKDLVFRAVRRSGGVLIPSLVLDHKLESDRLLTRLHDDPRWKPFVRTIGLADEQLK